MSRYFTNTKTFVDQADPDEPSYGHTFQPGEFWQVWNDWSRKYPELRPGWDGDVQSKEEGWVEKTEADFDAVEKKYVLVSTCKEEDYHPNLKKSWREIFGVEEAE